MIAASLMELSKKKDKNKQLCNKWSEKFSLQSLPMLQVLHYLLVSSFVPFHLHNSFVFKRHRGLTYFSSNNGIEARIMTEDLHTIMTDE